MSIRTCVSSSGHDVYRRVADRRIYRKTQWKPEWWRRTMKNVNSTQQYNKRNEKHLAVLYIHTHVYIIIISIIILLLHIIALYTYRAALFSFDLFGQRLCTVQLSLVYCWPPTAKKKWRIPNDDDDDEVIFC
jgi:hypothetical protein